MILDKIVVQNFGVYGDRHQIDLTPPSPEKPIILIGALNGAGKTTLLDALQLAFYGPQAQCSGRGRLAYKDYLRAMIHRGVDSAEGAAIEVHFRRFTEGQSRKMCVRRTWRDVGNGIEEFVDVQVKDRHDAMVSEHWQEYIENYLPLRLSNLFFFDGEQITTMAEDGHSAEILSTAIHSLLGLDLVDRLQSDLGILERRKRPTPSSQEVRSRLEKLETEVKEAETAERTAHDEKAKLKSVLDRQRLKELPEMQRRFKNEGGELFERRSEIEAAREQADKEVAETEAALREMASGPLPLLLVQQQLEQVEQQARFEIDIQHSKVIAQAEIKRDREVLKTLKRQRLDAAALQAVEAALTTHRPVREVDEMRLYLHPAEDFSDGLRRLREVVLPQAKKAAAICLEKSWLARERLARLEAQLDAVPDSEAIGSLQRDLVAMEDQIRQREAEYRLAEEKHRQLVLAHEQKRRQLQHFLETAVDISETAEDDKRVLAYIPKVKYTLTEFKTRAIARHVATIERLVLESFSYLLHKKNLVSGLRVDPHDFQISLTGGDGKALPIERLSAGERQLLATAVLWGLAKASGRPMPTVIDTPLGRLDSSHRIHLVERYFPAASHQVVLLSTDEEIIGRYLELLEPHIGGAFTLVFDETMGTTLVHKGYILKHEAAR